MTRAADPNIVDDRMRSHRPSLDAPQSTAPPTTPDGRYIVVRGRLWRRANPALDAERLADLTAELMNARRAVSAALRNGDGVALAAARSRVDVTKVALGERGPVWWTDGTPDQNRRMARNTTYAAWFAALGCAS